MPLPEILDGPCTCCLTARSLILVSDIFDLFKGQLVFLADAAHDNWLYLDPTSRCIKCTGIVTTDFSSIAFQPSKNIEFGIARTYCRFLLQPRIPFLFIIPSPRFINFVIHVAEMNFGLSEQPKSLDCVTVSRLCQTKNTDRH
ncbi:hypothetical protein CY34DRAFT_452507 [Suillus luteus UH-Slu-Lm8-n1]|uniref:Uncharacterized protein n=1 Tax=Suillus luteus UH-Slu-Lm8-n1 TaxID=930992 RepID=A0A0D0ATI2_9AGAM|nr:hypothetical protein CY34DRAFT_452507 [Suillus luteus UH-Slu-Lm8-n1]